MKNTLFIIPFFILAACSCKDGDHHFLPGRTFAVRQAPAVPGGPAEDKNDRFYLSWKEEDYDANLALLKADPGMEFSPLLLFLIARDLSEEGRNKDALYVLNRLIREEGKRDESLFLRAKIYFQQGYLGLADEDYAFCSKTGDFKAESLYWRGVIHLQLDEYWKAEDIFKASKDLGDYYSKKMLQMYFHHSKEGTVILE